MIKQITQHLHWPIKNSDTVARLLHGRGQLIAGFEQVNIDYFNGIVVIYLYQPFEQLAELLKLRLGRLIVSRPVHGGE